MSRFTKKGEITFLILSCLFVLTGSILVMFSEQLLQWLPIFLQEKVFHRTFSIEQYKDSMLSLLAFPIFIVILINAVFFIKLSDKGRCILLIFYISTILISLTIVSYFRANSFVDSDLSSEMLFARECFKEKTFWPTTWYYSMEFRLINTQLFTAPLFLFTKNLCLIRALTVLFCNIVLSLSALFLLVELDIKKWWIRLLGMLLVISPASWQFFSFVQVGCYYIPHIAFSFFYIGLFLSLVYHNHSIKKQKILSVIFILLSFISGLSSIRYILNFTLPLFAILFLVKLFNTFKNHDDFSGFKEIVKSIFHTDNKIDKPLVYALLGFLVSIIGYVGNSVILASIFTYKNMNKIQLNPLSMMEIDDIIAMILSVTGYNDNVSVFTPGGITSVLLVIVIISTIYIFTKLLKNESDGQEKTFVLFVLFMSAFHLYTNICAEMVDRYLTMVFVFFIPILAIVIQFYSSNKVFKLPSYILAVSSSIMIMTNAYLCIGKMVTTSKTNQLNGVCKYLKDNNYEFGYGFFNIANPIWFLTNGEIEVVTLGDNKIDDIRTLPSEFYIDKWLEPKGFTDPDYYKGSKPVFCVLQKKEYEITPNKYILECGKEVYKDDYCIVFEYKSPADFIGAFTLN